MRKLRKGFEVRRWSLQKKIGGGGNGEVWKAIDPEGEAVAVKFLLDRHSNSKNRVERFENEIVSMRNCADIAGVLPILDSNVDIGTEEKTRRLWYATPLGIPLEKRMPHFSNEDAATLCLSISRTLWKMHERGHSHRDVKPGNILLVDDDWHLADFGLASFPDKASITKKFEKLGPAHYIAPEMLNDAEGADGRKADVYSLSKLLWVLLSGQKYPLPGQHQVDSDAMSLSSYNTSDGISSIDRLLELSSVVDPSERLTMKEFHNHLEDWLKTPATTMDATDLSDYRRIIHKVMSKDINIRSEEEKRAERTKILIKRASSRLETSIEQLHARFTDAGIPKIWFTGAHKDGVTFSEPSRFEKELFDEVDGNYLSIGYSQNAEIDRREPTIGVRLEVRGSLWMKFSHYDVRLEDPAFYSFAHVIWWECLDEREWLWHKKEVLWKGVEAFHIGMPSERNAARSLEASLNDQLPTSIGSLVEACETMMVDPHSSSGGYSRI